MYNQLNWQADVCGMIMMCLQAACKLLARYTTRFSGRHSAIYSTLTVGSTGTLAYELNFLQVTQGRSRSFELTPMSRACVSSY